MEVIRSPEAMQGKALVLRREGRRIGFVPTMGCLHEGHLSLVKIARGCADIVVLSIFVNPIQFLPGEDFSQYPRPYERDEALCRDAGVDIVFYPEEQYFYAFGHSVYVEEMALSKGLCGASRPGHFKGVTTVVTKLFNIVQPDVAVFGQKDAQQARIIRRMVRDLNMPVDVVLGPIVRESDGLAMSSRNKYLSPVERQDALCLSHALHEARRMIADGERSVRTVRNAMLKVINRVASAKVDYVEFVDDESLEALSELKGKVLVAVAVKIGNTRLIDNEVFVL